MTLVILRAFHVPLASHRTQDYPTEAANLAMRDSQPPAAERSHPVNSEAVEMHHVWVHSVGHVRDSEGAAGRAYLVQRLRSPLGKGPKKQARGREKATRSSASFMFVGGDE